MREKELKEYRAGFCRSVSLIYAFMPFLANKHPRNEDPVLLLLWSSPVSTMSGKPAQQQNLKPAVGLGRRRFSGHKVNHVGHACPLPDLQRAAREVAAAK